jgi:hypothetical protein
MAVGESVMHTFRWFNTHFGPTIITAFTALLLLPRPGVSAEDSQYKIVDGLAIYLGVLPAEMVKGHPPGHPEQAMHGGAPKGPHQYHVVAAIFDSTSGARISDAVATAQVSGLGLSGPKRQLEPMQISDTITYGGFFNLPGPDLYTIRLTITRPGVAPVLVDFKYDHRR